MRRAAGKRHRWIDLARGMAMVMVVFGHALVGATASLEPTHISQFCILLLYCVHMPVFFVLAGRLSDRMVSRPPAQFFAVLSKRIVWPYLLWSSLLLLMHFVMSDYTNAVVVAYRPWTILWRPPAVMWFLYVLFFAILLRWALRKNQWMTIFTGSLCLCLPYIWDVGNGHIRFVGLYLLASALPRGLFDQLQNRWVRSIAVAVFGILVCLAWRESAVGWAGYPGASRTFFAAMLVCPMLAVALAKGLSRLKPDRFDMRWVLHRLQLVGRHSMAIFVLHIFFTAGTRILLLQFGLSDLWAMTFVSTIAGVVLPLWISMQASNRRVGPLLGWQNA